jgi:hypothetical protein
LPIYVDESGSLSAGAMIMAGVEVEEAGAAALLDRFRAVTGLHGELKGSRIALIERAFFFELFERFGGRARVCIVRMRDQPAGAAKPEDFDVYVALLTQLVDEWLPDAGDCANVIIDTGRYDAMVLEGVRQDIARLLASCGTARMADSRRTPGVQIADVVANSFYNIAIQSRRANSIHTIVEPFQGAGLIRTSRLRTLPAPRQKHPALQGNAGRRVRPYSGEAQPS